MIYFFLHSFTKKGDFLVPQTSHCGLKSSDFRFSFFFLFNNPNLSSTKNDHVTFSDITNLFPRILRSRKFFFRNVFFFF